MLQLATAADRAAVNELARQSHEMHVNWRPDLYETVPELYPEERFRDAVRQRQLYVAKVDGISVGYVLLKVREYDWSGVVRRKEMVIDAFCVHTMCRRQGIATRMMEDVRALGKAFGCAELQLGVYPQNDAAVAFYQKCGFLIRSITMQQKL